MPTPIVGHVYTPHYRETGRGDMGLLVRVYVTDVWQGRHCGRFTLCLGFWISRASAVPNKSTTRHGQILSNACV